MIVYFVRHASAGQHNLSPSKDEKRPLDREGVQQAHQVGRLLAAMDLDVDVVISSPLTRALQTASAVAGEIGYEQKIESDAALRPDATFDSFRQLIAKYSQKAAIMVVGHNPSMSEFLTLVLSRGHEREMIDFKKGAVARVEMGRKSGTLQWCLTPKVAAAAYAAAAPAPSANGQDARSRSSSRRKPAKPAAARLSDGARPR
jgi:phosphohistidine phosphatase